MGFFYNEEKTTKKTAAPRSSSRMRDIPIASLNSLGCSVCPRDKDRDLRSPKLKPSGSDSPLLYVLTHAPSLVDDEQGQWMRDKAGRVVSKLIPRDFWDQVRFGGVTQCAQPEGGTVTAHEVECCRGRVEADIEHTKPMVVLGVGDLPLAWATHLDAYAPKFRGRMIVAKIGAHVCWYYPVNYPNFVHKESKYGPSDQEVALEHDITKLLQLIDNNDWPNLSYHKGSYDSGIECITGQSAGDFQRLERALADIAALPRAGLDLETNGLRPWVKNSHIWTAAVGSFERVIAFPLDHPEGWGSEHQQRKVWQLFGEFILYSGIKECHSLSFELEWLSYFYGKHILRAALWDDTMSMAHTIDERPGTKSLEVQCLIHFGFNLKALSNIDVKRILEYPLERVLKYNAMDSKWTNKLSRELRPIIAADPSLRYAHDRKVRLASALVTAELRGLPTDMDYAFDIEERMEKEAARVATTIQHCPEVIRYTNKFGTFSPTNSDHVLKLMDKVCNREEVTRAVKGGGHKMTSDEEALSAIPASEVPSAALILEHRSVEKLLSTYVRPLTSGKIVSGDGRIHSKYSSMTAVTHRLAGEDPNPQNWPKRKHKEVRGVVAAGKNKWILAADYGQIEFRVAAMCSEDENLVKMCWTGYDVHMHWAKRVYEEYPEIADWIVETIGVDWDEKGMKALRQEMKNRWVFPSIFGAAVRSRAASLQLPEDVAKRLDDEFWDELPDVLKWQQRLLKRYQKDLYVETLGGLRRYGPMSPNEIINMPIQGTAAEIVTEAMIALSERALLEEDEDIDVILNVHDDLSFEPDDEGLEGTIDVIAHEMCKHRFDYINVPLVVEVSIGPRWSELKEVGVYRSDDLFNLRNPFK